MKVLVKSVLCFITLFLSVACSDFESFGNSVQSHLSFSSDTIHLDTVFSNIPTSMRSFWIYNRSNGGIRCSTISLQNKNRLGFRVNIDGTYIGSANDYTLYDVEIRKGDSIRAFVELTSPVNGSSKPKALEDYLLFKLENGIEQKVVLDAWSLDARILSNVTLKQDTIIGDSIPIIIYNGLCVDKGVTLRLNAGTTLYFHSGATLDVYGTLLAEGTAEHNVVLRGDRIDNMFDYLPYDLTSGQWNGLRFHTSSYGNKLNYTDIHSTFHGIVCDSADMSIPKLELLHSTIHNCQGNGLQSSSCYVAMSNSIISNTLEDCLHLEGGICHMNHITLAQFYPFDSPTGYALFFSNKGSQPYELVCNNSLITGNSPEVVSITTTDTVSSKSISFISSILRTPTPTDTTMFKNVIWESATDTIHGGSKHFKQVDYNTQHYDFHLGASSSAVDSADPTTALPIDRDGFLRDIHPDIGAFEFKH